jgi:hypothetical protein
MATVDDICFPEGKEIALAAARKVGKPLLTTDGLNEFGQKQEANKALAAEAIKDIPAFVRAHFYLTPAQDQFLSKVPAAQWNELTAGLQAIAQQGGKVTFASKAVASIPGKGGVLGKGTPIASPDKHKEVTVSLETPVGKLTVHTVSDS